MTDLFQGPDDATPLTPDERDALLQSWITHRRDLDEAEQENIVKGAAWARGRRNRRPTDLLVEDFASSANVRRRMEMGGRISSDREKYRDRRLSDSDGDTDAL